VRESARGKNPDHWRYRKVLRDGTILETKVSHSTMQYGHELWSRIWKHQLGLASASEFWQVLATGTPANRPGDLPPPSPAGHGLSIQLVTSLTKVANIPMHEVAKMTPEEAQKRWNEFLGLE
jgi:hypothetical protein